jgi:hypothetical protein
VELDDLPVKGLEPLEPLLAYLIVYLVVLVALRLFLWPMLRVFLFRRGPLLFRRLTLLLARAVAAGLVLLGLVWALAALGLSEPLYEAFDELGSVDLPALGTVPLFFLFLLLLVYLFVIRPALKHLRSSKK